MARHKSLPAPVHPVSGNELLFEERPIEIGGFLLQARAATVKGRPSLEQWRGALEFACASYEGSPYWIGDLISYAENREDWRERLDQAMAITGLAEQTLHNLGYISRRIGESTRRIAPTVSHAAEVAKLEPADQALWLDKARTEGWNARELRVEIRAARRAAVIEGQAQLEGMFRVIYADPPWQYENRQPSGSGQADHYPPMTIAEICALPVKAHALRDSVLFMWVTAPTCLENPGPRDVGEAWGFTYKQQMIWDKVEGTHSYYTGGNHEVLTIWTRGSCTADVPTGLPDSVQSHRKSRTHSGKPEEFRRLIEKHWNRGPYLELFGRRRVEGWTVLGNDARLWAEEMEGAHA